MTLPVDNIIAALESHAASSGHFDRINTHEPKNAPGNGLTCAIWMDRLEMLRNGSGLSIGTGLMTVNVRLYSSMIQEPQDTIDANLVKAVDALFTAYSGDFELGGNVRNIDLLGAQGVPLMAQAGYLEQDKKIYRVFTIVVPMVINDLWNQSA